MNHFINTKFAVTILHLHIILAVILNFTGGCAESPSDKSGIANNDSWTSYSQDNDPVKTLINLAMAEPGGSPVKYPPPPAIDSASIMLHNKNDTKVFMSLNDVVNQLSISNKQDNNNIDTQINPQKLDNDTIRESTALYLQGREEYLDGSYYESIRNLEQALRYDPNGTDIIRLLAYDYLQTVGRAKANTYFQKLYEIDAHDTEALLHLGLAAYDNKDWKQVILLLADLVNNKTQSVDKSPSTNNLSEPMVVLAAYKLGSALFNLGYDTAGISMWESIVIPDNLNLADIQHIQQDFNELIRNRALIKQGIGDARTRLGQYDKALIAYEQAAALPIIDRGAILDRLVYVQLQQGKPYAAMVSIMRGITTPYLSEAAIKLVHHYDELPSSQYLGHALAYEAMQNTDSLPLLKAAARILPADIRDTLIGKYISENHNDQNLLLNIVIWAYEEYGLPQAMQYYIQYSDTQNIIGQEEPARLLTIKISDPRMINDAWSSINSDLKSTTSARMFHIWMLYTAAQYNSAHDYLSKLIDEQPDLIAAQLLNIEILIKREQREDARAVLKTIPLSSITLNPGLLKQYIELHKQINLNEKAIAELQVVLDKFNNEISDTECWTTKVDGFTLRDVKYYLAQLLINSNNLQQADTQLRDILNYDTSDEAIYALLLNIHGPDGSDPNPEIFRELTGDIARNLRDSRLFRYLRAQNDSARGRHDQALSDYLQLVREDPNDSQVMETLVHEWIRTDQLIQALQWLQDRLAEQPGDVRLLHWMVNVLVQDRQYDNALNKLQSWLDIHPLDEDTARVYESILVLDGQKEKAQKSALSRLLKRPESFERACALAEYTITIEDYSNTLKYLQEALKLSPDSDPYRLESVIRIAAKQADRDPDNKNISFQFINQTIDDWQAMGHTISRQSHIWGIDASIRIGLSYDDIIRRLDLARQEYSDDSLQFTVYTVVLLNSSEREDDACRLMDNWLDLGNTVNARTLTSQDIPIASRRIQFAAQRSEVDLAVELVRRLSDADLLDEVKEIADEVSGGDKIKLSDALYSLSGLFYRADDHAASEEILRVALKTDPQHAGANNDLGYALADKGIELDKAEKMLLIAYLSDPTNEAFIDSMGWLRYKQGRFEDVGTEPENLGAATLLLKASMDSSGSSDPVILDHLGDTYWRMNQIDEAVKTWGRIKYVYKEQLDMAKDIDENYEITIRAAYESVADNAEAKIKAVQDGQKPNIAPCPALDNKIIDN